MKPLYGEPLEPDVEYYYDPILSDEHIEIDYNWIAACMQRAKEIESDIVINILTKEQLQAYYEAAE